MIEDIEYLKEHCENDSTVIYIDSNERNRTYFPTPENYAVSFEQPFRLVTGFDILDASIPTTMWNVDKYNGTLAITTARIPGVDQTNAERFFKEIKDTVFYYTLFERLESGVYTENYIQVVTSTWYEQQNIVPSDTKTPYYLVARYVVSNTNIVQAANNTDDTLVFPFTYRDIKYYVSLNDPNVEILMENNFHIELNENNLYDLIYFVPINITKAVYDSGNKNIVVDVRNYYKQITLGNYDITTLKTELNAVWDNENIGGPSIQISTTVSPDEKQGILTFTSRFFIAINANIGRLIKQLGFDTNPSPYESDKYQICNISDNKLVFGSLYNADISKYVVTAPGIVNLLGDRYIILRCPEIEQHLLGSFAYTRHSPGIGLFKLAAGYSDLTHLRFDFVNLVRKPFHPIGKLSKITIRFETQSGDLYDFKGVNHQMLFVVKYLVPTQKVTFQKSLLNPNYDANFMRYMSTSKTIENKEDSDQEDDFHTKEYDDKFNKNMQKYDYSSSESGGGTDDSEVEFDFTSRR